MTLHTIWGTFRDDDLDAQARCDQCGRPVYRDTPGSFGPDDDGEIIFICRPCLRPRGD